MTKISTYNFILKGGITSEPGKNTYVVPYKPGDVQTDFAGNGAMLLVNGGRLILREDTDTFQLTFGASSFTITWRDLLHTVGDTDDVSITTDIFNTFVGLGIAGSTPGGPAGGDLTGTYPDPLLKAIVGAGTFGDATHIPVVTIDAKGRVTALTTILATSPGTSVPGGPAGGDLAGTYPNPALILIPALGAGGTVGDATHVPQLTYDSKGRITGIVSVPIVGVPGPATGPAGGDLTGVYPDPSIRAGAVMNAQLAAMGQGMVKGRLAGSGSGQPMDLNQAGIVGILNTAPLTFTQPLQASTITATGAINGGSTITAPGGVILGAPTGGDLGPGTVNVSNGFYVNGKLFKSGGGVVTGTSTRTNVPAAITSTQLLAANALRLGASVYNDSPAEMYLNLGAAASNTAFTVDMLPGAYYEVPFGFFGAVFAIWANATGAARITEFFE
jgi:hypothetical protein